MQERKIFLVFHYKWAYDFLPQNLTWAIVSESFLLAVILEKDQQIFLCFDFRLYHWGTIKATLFLADLLSVWSSKSISAATSCHFHFLTSLFLHTKIFFHSKFFSHVFGVKQQTSQARSFWNERFQTGKPGV